jgi:hypothetical protein
VSLLGEQRRGIRGIADIQHTKSAPASSAPVSSAPAAPPAAPAASPESAASVFSFLTIGFYQPLFDVCTKDVLRRLLAAYWGFLRPSLLQLADYVPTPTSEEEAAAEGATAPPESSVGLSDGGPVSLFTTKPDLYGPLWVGATLVFLIGAMANLGSWATAPSSSVEETLIWKYDFSLVTQAFALVFGSLVFVPLVAWSLLRYHGAPPLSLVTLVCLWGYSLCHYLPAAILSALPSLIVRWLVTAFATVGASLFLLRAIVPIVQPSRALVTPVAGAVVGLQLVVGLLLRLYFFSFTAVPL